MFHHLHSPEVRLLIDSPNSLPGIKRIVLFTWFIYSWWHDCLRLFVLPRYDSFSGWRSGRQKDSGCTDRCHAYIFRRIPFASLYSLSLAFMFVFSVCQDTIDDGIWCLYSRHQWCCTLPLTWQWRSISWWTLPRLWSQVGIRGIFERTCHIHSSSWNSTNKMLVFIIWHHSTTGTWSDPQFTPKLYSYICDIQNV